MCKRILVFLLLILCTQGFCKEKPKPKICLNMIVKDETGVIRRCLDSVKPLIDYWVIVDTGSKDGTQKLVKEIMKGIPGELHERPWVNFEHNRNEALQLAKKKAEYLLFIDADDILVYDDDFAKPTNLTEDAYFLKIRYGGMEYDRIQLINTNLDWKWVGVVHEVLVCDQPHTPIPPHLKGVFMKIIGGGGRSADPKKFYKDAQLLETALKKDPTNARSMFYLAQSYRDAEMPELALKNYEKRVEMGGWDQEVFWSLYQIALLKERINSPQDEVIKAYEKAFLYRSQRVEPLYQLASYYRRHENYLMGYLVARLGLEIKKSQDVLFVESWMHEYGMLLEYSICAYHLGRYDEALEASHKLEQVKNAPQGVYDCVKNNLHFITERMGGQVAG